MEIMMQTGQKILIGISIVVGVICIELSMYIIPFIEEVKEGRRIGLHSFI